VVTEMDNPSALLNEVGTKLGPTAWLIVDQRRIDRFAAATGDDQWIHVDPVRAAEGPYGGTIAHGYLTLSLTNYFLPQLLQVRRISMGINYGVDRVRYPAVVRVGSRLRAHGEIVSAKEVDKGVQVTVRIAVEIEGSQRPACVVDSISRFLDS
jgi:acyl dehydratase